MAPRAHLSGVGGDKRWMGRKRGDGSAGLWLRAVEGRQHLVSHQPARSGDLHAGCETRPHATECISSRQLRDRRRGPRLRLDAGGPPLRRAAAHVPAAADRPWRADCPRVVVGHVASDAESRAPGAGEPHRLVLVHRVADGLRRGRGHHRRSTLAEADARKRLVCLACWHRGARNHVTSRRGIAVTRLRSLLAPAALASVLLAGCGVPPGQPLADSIAIAPGDVVEFDALYAANCAACHGPNGRGGAAIALANAVYLAIVDDRSMRARIAAGVRGTSMPAFAQRAGGMLTEKQV